LTFPKWVSDVFAEEAKLASLKLKFTIGMSVVILAILAFQLLGQAGIVPLPSTLVLWILAAIVLLFAVRDAGYWSPKVDGYVWFGAHLYRVAQSVQSENVDQTRLDNEIRTLIDFIDSELSWVKEHSLILGGAIQVLRNLRIILQRLNGMSLAKNKGKELRQNLEGMTEPTFFGPLRVLAEVIQSKLTIIDSDIQGQVNSLLDDTKELTPRNPPAPLLQSVRSTFGSHVGLLVMVLVISFGGAIAFGPNNSDKILIAAGIIVAGVTILTYLGRGIPLKGNTRAGK
jgi:hypothetical protein